MIKMTNLKFDITVWETDEKGFIVSYLVDGSATGALEAEALVRTLAEKAEKIAAIKNL